MSIHIKKSHEGLFTAKAKAHHKSVSSYAQMITHSPSASTKTKKQAQFAINARKWHHGS